MEAGDKVDGGIEGVRSPMVVKSEALDEQQSTLTYAVMGITLLIVCITGLVSVVLARRIKAIIGTELHGINDSITNIAVGNLSVDIPHSHRQDRSEEHTSELQSLMRISYAVFCLKKKNTNQHKSKKKKQKSTIHHN